MKIRLETTPEVFARLCGAINDNDSPLHVRPAEVFDDGYAAAESNAKAIKLIRGKSEDGHKVEIDLDVQESIRPGEIVYALKGATWEKPVFRHKVDALFDVLGIFPRTNLTKLERLKELLAETYELATDITHDVRVPGSLPTNSPEWKISMGLGELRTGLERVAERFGFKPFFMK